MADFQSFLFQNMQMIGLEEDDEDRKLQKSNISATSSSANCSDSSKSSTKTSTPKDGKIFKAFGSISVSTTETYLSNSNINRKELEMNIAKKVMSNAEYRIEEDPYDLNNQEPKFVKKKSMNDSYDIFPEPPVETMEFFHKKDQMFESNVMDLDMNYIISNDIEDEIRHIQRSDGKIMSSPESNIKFSFKSSTPILVCQDKKSDDSMSQDEREVKSPKLAKKNVDRLSYRKFSPCRSIFEKKTMSKASLNSFNEDESFGKGNYRLNRSARDDIGNSNYIVSSRIFDKKKLNMALKSNTSSESELNANSSSLESILMEPYLVKFEEELIKNSKSEIIKDLTNLNQSLAMEQQTKSSTRLQNQKNVFQKYFNEIKNLTLKKSKPGSKHKNLDLDMFKKSDMGEELVYEDDDVYQKTKQEILNKDNLRVISKSQIPWQNLDLQSSNQLLNAVVENLNQTTLSEDLPVLYSKKGNKISKNQVKRWFDLLDKLAQSEVSKNPELDTTNHSVHKSKLYSSKQYLMNKKRQFMEKVSKKTSKTQLLDVSQTGSETSKNVSKLYANVIPPEERKLDESLQEEITEVIASPKKSKKPKEQNYVNENYFKNDKEEKTKSPKKNSSDHFYNEITDLEQRQAVRHKNREKERVDRNAETEARNLSKKNSEILQQIVDYTETSFHDSTSNMIFKRNIAAIAKLKSPERKILYKEWFTILKRMEKDPKFDLETLVRTRGRFTDNDKISYRTKLMEKSEKIRSARSEPNFSTMFASNRANKSRNGMNTTPASKASRGINFDPIEKNGNTSTNKNNKMVMQIKPEPTLQNALKLTLEKSDINKIKDLLKKKDKSLKTDLTNLKEKTNQRRLQTKAEMANQKKQLSSHAIINEECEDNEDNLKIRQNSHIHKKQTNNSTSKSNKNKIGNFSNLSDSILEPENMDDEAQNNSTNVKNESKLVSKCKKMYNSSDTAKAFTEVTKMVKGLKIGNKIKNLTNSSSKFLHKAIHNNEDQNDSVNSDDHRSGRHKNSYDLKSTKSNSETGSQASFTLSSSNISEEEMPRRSKRNTNRHEEERIEKRGSSSRKDDKNIKARSKDRSGARGGSSKVSASPARPPPPKRPPPPRPFSPTTSCSSISTNIKKSSSRHKDEEDESFSATPPQCPKRSANHLPPRPKPPSNLPPRPPKSRHRNEESFDEQSFEIEERNHRSKNQERYDDRQNERLSSRAKRTSSNNSRQDVRDERKPTSRNTTPVRSPNVMREIKSRSNVRKDRR